MKEYKPGEFYNFWVKGIGNNIIVLEDEEGTKFNVYAYDFQTEWDWASPQVPVSVMNCYVTQVHETGKVVLEQNRKNNLIVLYPEASKNEAKVYKFVYEYKRVLGNKEYYILRDVYGLTHKYKPENALSDTLIGAEIEVEVVGINDRPFNKPQLILKPVAEKQEDVQLPAVDTDETPVGEFGEESDVKEFKSTIVYPAGATSPDMDTQMQVIVRTLAGFMNAKGGVLYIGVNDNGDAIGIEQEYKLLNISNKDNNHYQENKDGYENKIRASINWKLNPEAQDYVTFSFKNHNNHTVCVAEVKESDTVIWFNQYFAYKRIGNRTAHLRSTAIEKLVLDKMKATRPETINIKPVKVEKEEDILPPEVINDSEPETDAIVAKVEKPVIIACKGELRQGNGSFYMNMFANDEWSWSRDIPSDDDLEFCIPINNRANKNDLIMVYEDGCVNRVDAYHLHLNKKENRRYKNGRRGDGVKLVKVFHAKADDLLACFCKQNGHEFVKVHNVSHVSQHGLMNLNGNRVINTTGKNGVTDAEIFFVSSQHEQRVSALKKTENQVSNSLGFDLGLQKNAKFLQVTETLKALCDVPEQ